MNFLMRLMVSLFVEAQEMLVSCESTNDVKELGPERAFFHASRARTSSPVYNF